MVIYRIVDLNTNKIVNTYNNYFDAVSFCEGKNNYGIYIIEKRIRDFLFDDLIYLNDVIIGGIKEKIIRFSKLKVNKIF